MAEKLSVFIPPRPAPTAFTITDFDLHRHVDVVATELGQEFRVSPAKCCIWVQALGDNGQTVEDRWTGQTAYDDIIALNKANLSTHSLEKRLFLKLVARGKLDGSVEGTPD